MKIHYVATKAVHKKTEKEKMVFMVEGHVLQVVVVIRHAHISEWRLHHGVLGLWVRQGGALSRLTVAVRQAVVRCTVH